MTCERTKPVALSAQYLPRVCVPRRVTVACMHACERACVRALRPMRACVRACKRACVRVGKRRERREATDAMRAVRLATMSGWSAYYKRSVQRNARRGPPRRRSALPLAPCRSGGSSRAFGGIPVRIWGTRASKGTVSFGSMGNVLRRTSVRTTLAYRRAHGLSNGGTDRQSYV